MSGNILEYDVKQTNKQTNKQTSFTVDISVLNAAVSLINTQCKNLYF